MQTEQPMRVHIHTELGSLHAALDELAALLPKLPEGFGDVVEALFESGRAIALHEDGSVASGAGKAMARLEPTKALLGLVATARAFERQLDAV